MVVVTLVVDFSRLFQQIEAQPAVETTQLQFRRTPRDFANEDVLERRRISVRTATVKIQPHLVQKRFEGNLFDDGKGTMVPFTPKLRNSRVPSFRPITAAIELATVKLIILCPQQGLPKRRVVLSNFRNLAPRLFSLPHSTDTGMWWF